MPATGSMPSTGTPGVVIVLEQVAVVAGQLDHQAVAAPARARRSGARPARGRAPPAPRSPTRSTCSRRTGSRGPPSPTSWNSEQLVHSTRSRGALGSGSSSCVGRAQRVGERLVAQGEHVDEVPASAGAAGGGAHAEPAAARASRQRRSPSSRPSSWSSLHPCGCAWKREAVKSSSVTAAGPEGVAHLLAPRSRTVHWGWKPGSWRGDLVERHAVAALVGRGAVGEGHRRSGHHLLHDLGHVADLVVLVVAPDVEGLVVYRLARRLEHGQEGARDVLDVHQRAPRACRRWTSCTSPVMQANADQVVDHQVAAQPGREPVGGGVAQEDRREVARRPAGRCPARPAPWTRP